jgi:hypothetical protein
MTMSTAPILNDAAEKRDHRDRKIARLGFTILLLLIVIASAVWSGIAVWFVGHTLDAW